MTEDSRARERVLVMVSGRRDAELTRSLLANEGIEPVICPSARELCYELDHGAEAALLAEEVLTLNAVQEIAQVLARQPPWSDFPIVVFGSTGNEGVRDADDGLRALGNVTFLDRPVRVRSMLAAVHASIRSRSRQYAARLAIESRDQFLAMLGHELRNPLGAIRLAVSLLDKKVPAPERPREQGIIDRQSAHLARLVDDLLDVARITHGKVVLKSEPLNLVEIVRNSAETLEARARERGLRCLFELGEAEVWVDGDRQRLEQVLMNLFTNALKYTPPGGSITVGVEANAGHAVVSVTDTGIGLAPDMLDRVFDAFAQADRSLDRAEGGIGLGLALVRSVVQLHRGSIEAFSEGLGRGSSFVLKLPRAEDARASRPLPSENAHPAGRRRVVVVEDNADIRELLSETLRLAGHEVVARQDGHAGLDEILGHGPDIAFVDLGLPELDGLELARRARAAGCRARLVALSGYGQPDDIRRARDAGFDEHLTKPVVGSDVELAVARLERAAPSEVVPVGAGAAPRGAARAAS